MHELENLIDNMYNLEYSKEAKGIIFDSLSMIDDFVKSNHFLRTNYYYEILNEIHENAEELSSWTSREDRMLQRIIQKRIIEIAKKIMDENKRIFIVHGRNIGMRDKVSSLLGRLKLDYVILESEQNQGGTIIEKFLSNAEKCEYAIVLFSGDDIGSLDVDKPSFSRRARQNVILELGYFLGTVGRENLIILHQAGVEIEKPSDYSGVVYEAFDEYGAWKTKLINEMKRAKIYIDTSLAERV